MYFQSSLSVMKVSFHFVCHHYFMKLDWNKMTHFSFFLRFKYVFRFYHSKKYFNLQVFVFDYSVQIIIHSDLLLFPVWFLLWIDVKYFLNYHFCSFIFIKNDFELSPTNVERVVIFHFRNLVQLY